MALDEAEINLKSNVDDKFTANLTASLSEEDGETEIELEEANMGVHFSPHDLRRTFCTYAESLDISSYALKRLMNHKLADVTGSHYIVINVERLREPAQKIADFILRNLPRLLL